MSTLLRLSSRNRLLVGLIAAAAVFGVAGGVYASIPDAGVIHGCYKTNSGSLRVINGGGCSASETPLDWSQTGPAGAPGPMGPTGPRGPSDLWEARGGIVALPQTDLSDPSTYLPLPVIKSVPLQAGSYFVSSTIYLLDFANPAGFICYLDGPPDTMLFSGQASNYQADEPTSITLQSALTLASPSTVALHCASNGADSEGFGTRLDAIQVGSVHTVP
jgi:hypothetical protein